MDGVGRARVEHVFGTSVTIFSVVGKGLKYLRESFASLRAERDERGSCGVLRVRM